MSEGKNQAASPIFPPTGSGIGGELGRDVLFPHPELALRSTTSLASPIARRPAAKRFRLENGSYTSNDNRIPESIVYPHAIPSTLSASFPTPTESTYSSKFLKIAVLARTRMT